MIVFMIFVSAWAVVTTVGWMWEASAGGAEAESNVSYYKALVSEYRGFWNSSEKRRGDLVAALHEAGVSVEPYSEPAKPAYVVTLPKAVKR